MKIDCCVAKDLIPLYVENLLSDETAAILKEHLEECEKCKNEYLKEKDNLPNFKDYENDESINSFSKSMKRVNRRLGSFFYCSLILLFMLGCSLTDGEGLFYNTVILPIAGALGYYAFGLHSLYKLPILLAVVEAFAYFTKMTSADLSQLLFFTPIYFAFVLAGILIALLLHYGIKGGIKK